MYTTSFRWLRTLRPSQPQPQLAHGSRLGPGVAKRSRQSSTGDGGAAFRSGRVPLAIDLSRPTSGPVLRNRRVRHSGSESHCDSNDKGVPTTVGTGERWVQDVVRAQNKGMVGCETYPLSGRFDSPVVCIQTHGRVHGHVHAPLQLHGHHIEGIATWPMQVRETLGQAAES